MQVVALHRANNEFPQLTGQKKQGGARIEAVPVPTSTAPAHVAFGGSVEEAFVVVLLILRMTDLRLIGRRGPELGVHRAERVRG